MKANPQSAALDGATIQWDGSRLLVTCGAFLRQWNLTKNGLTTTLLQYEEKIWAERAPEAGDCDWHLFGLVDANANADLSEVRIASVENPPRAAPHVSALIEFIYPEQELALRYAIQTFPTAPGVRTQLSVRALRPFTAQDIPSYLLESYAESFRIPPEKYVRRIAGYYNDLQHRNHDDTPILKEETRSGDLAAGRREVYDWASLLSFESPDWGIILVKESHKCVNQPGIDTGAFVLHPGGVQVTGLGLTANHYLPGELWLSHDRFRTAWANWCVPYSGDANEGRLALKHFDRAWFMAHPEHNLRSHSNTWGTRYPGNEARAAAEQENVLKEIASCADLGINAVAIDDGWQFPMQGIDGESKMWKPHPDRFPEGWSIVREAASKAGVELNLWMPGAEVTLEQMIRNVEQGKFAAMKIDFLNFSTRDILETVMFRVARLVDYAGKQFQISWDVTENYPRLGYFWGREFGSLHIANRKPTYKSPRANHVAYCPRLVLRDAWHLARYINLNHIEIPIQDVDKVDAKISNAGLYPHGYCVAMALAGLPLFFMETHTLSEKARAEIRPLLKLWNLHRERIAKSYVFPIGDEPSDGSWTGFQCHIPETHEGYVLLFRELNAPKSEINLSLLFMKNHTIQWNDMLNETHWIEKNEMGSSTFRITESPGFRWLRYQSELP